MRSRPFAAVALGIVAVGLLPTTPAGATGAPTVNVGDASAIEGGDPRVIKIPVTLSGPASVEVDVTYRVVAGTATRTVGPGQDYSARLSGNLRFVPNGQGVTPTVKYVRIKVLGDLSVEPEETVGVVIDSVTGGGFGIGRAAGTATIIDDDPSDPLEIAIGDATLVEGDDGRRDLQFTVSLTRRWLSSDVIVYWRLDNGTAECAPLKRGSPTVVGQDCGEGLPAARPLVFKRSKAPPRTGIPGPTPVFRILRVPVLGDSAVEADEQFTITLTSAIAGDALFNTFAVPIRRAVGVGTILNDDA